MAAAAASTGQKTLRSAIQSGAFDRVYYLHGPEEPLKEEALRQLLAAAVDPPTRDFNLEVLRGGEVDAERLGSALGTPPMMSARRAVVVRDVAALRKDARAILDRYLEAPASDVVLVLVAPAGAKEDKIALTRTVAVEFEPLTGARIPKWIAHYAQQEHGCEITPDAANLLQDAVGNELGQLKIELDKLASFVPGGAGRTIDEPAVTAIVGVRRGETLGDLLDAVGSRNAALAIGLLPHILQQPKTTAVQVVMALTTQTLALAWANARHGRNASVRLEQELFGLLKEGSSSYTGRSWGEAVRAWSRNVDAWTPAELDAALDSLLTADATLKGSRLSSDEQVLETLILAMCGAPARRARKRIA